jgi:hypothetical protein
MSDTMTYDAGTNDPFITTLVDKWFTSKATVEQLDSEMKIESLGKTKLLNEVYNDVIKASPAENETENIATQFANTIKEMLDRAAAVTGEERPGSFFAGMMEVVRRTLNEKEYDDKLEAFTKAHVIVPAEGDKPSEAAMEQFRKDRKVAVDNMNGIRSLLEGTAPDWFTTTGKGLLLNAEGKEEEFKNLRGAIGKRGETGPRLALASTFTFTVDDSVLQDHKLAAVRDHVNKLMSIGDVRKAVESANEDFDWTNPPSKFEFDLKDKAGTVRHVVARKDMDSSAEDESSDELSLDVTTEVNEEGDSENTENAPVTFDDDDE